MTESQSAERTYRLQSIKFIGEERAKELWVDGLTIEDVATADVSLLTKRFNISLEQAKMMKGSAQGIVRARENK